MGIRELIKSTRTISKVKRFEELAEGKSNDEKRSLERIMLKPNVLQPYAGETPNKSPVLDRTVTMVMPTDNDMDLFKRHFRTSNYKGLNTRDIGIILALLDSIERGTLQYVHSEKKIYFIDDQGGRYET